MKARASRVIESSASTWDRPALAVFILGWVGALPLAFALVSTTRWWMLRQLDAEMFLSFSLVLPWLEIPSGRVGRRDGVLDVRRGPGVQGTSVYKLVAGVVIVGALFIGLTATASAGAAQASRCVDGVARSTTKHDHQLQLGLRGASVPPW